MQDPAYFKCACCKKTDLLVHPPTEKIFEEKLVPYNIPLIDEDGEVIMKEVPMVDLFGKPMMKPVYKKEKDGRSLLDKNNKRIISHMVPATVKEIQYEQRETLRKVPKMLKTKARDPHSHKEIDTEIQELKDLAPRALLVQLHIVGRDNVQVNFCTNCFDEKVKDKIIEFVSFLKGLHK